MGRRYRYGVKYFEVKTGFGGYNLQHPGRTSIVFDVSGYMNKDGFVWGTWQMLQGYKSGQPTEMVWVARWKIRKLKAYIENAR